MFINKIVILDYITKFKIVYFNFLLCRPFNDKTDALAKTKTFMPLQFIITISLSTDILPEFSYTMYCTDNHSLEES